MSLTPNSFADERVKIICSYASMNLDHRLSLDHLARKVNLSRWGLSHLFRRETGLSPMQWLKSQRIAHAKLLLEKTFLTVKEVRAQVGAPDASHFARQFRHAFGLSPIQFRAYRKPKYTHERSWPLNSKKGC